MATGNDLVKGILIGVGVSAVGFYLYKKNEDKVDSFLRGRGMDIKPRGSNYETMSVEELMRTKCLLNKPLFSGKRSFESLIQKVSGSCR